MRIFEHFPLIAKIILDYQWWLVQDVMLFLHILVFVLAPYKIDY